MKIILLKDVENLGREGEVKDVADGYARNLLIPQNMAELATDASIAKSEEKKLQLEKKAKTELEEAQKLAEQLEGRELFIKVKEKEGKLFGSVNEKTVAKVLKDEGINIPSSSINIAEPIKDMGEYDAQINLDHGLEANIRLILVGEES